MKIRPTKEFRVASFLAATLLSTLLAARAADESIRIPQLLMQAKVAVAALPKMEDRAHALCKIARIQAAAGDLNDALGTIESIGQLHMQDRDDFGIIPGMGLAEVAGVQVKRGDVGSAYAVARRVSNDLMKSEVYASIASAQAEIGDLDGALKTATRVLSPDNDLMSTRAATFAQIAHAWVQRGDLDAAKRVLEADRDNKSARVMAIKGDVEREILEAKIRGGLAEELLRAAGDTANSFTREGLGLTVACTLADMGRFSDAFAALELVSSPAWRERALTRIAIAQARHAEDDGLCETVSQIPSHYGQIMAWKEVASTYAAKGEKEKARRALEQVQPCQSRGNDSQPGEFCGAFAEVFVDLGDFTQAKTVISTIADQNQRWKVLRRIVRRLALTHNFEQARQLADLGSTEAHRMQFYQSIAVGMELSGASEDAVRFARNNIGPPFRDHAIVEVAKVRTRQGHTQEALALVSQINDRQAKVDIIVGVAESLLPASLREDDFLSEADALVKPLDRE